MTSALPIKISPSILGGDLGRLAEEAQRAEEAGADALHVDIMDGHFVRNLTLGPRALAAINRSTSLFLEVHIMVYAPFEYIEPLVEAGADLLIFHFEATENVEDTLSYIRKCGIKAGLAFNPETSASMMVNYIDKIDHLLLMTVHPGFGGQTFIPDVLEKVRFARELCSQKLVPPGENKGPSEQGALLQPVLLDIEVDGGINQETALQSLEAGANVLVSGSYLFQSQDMAAEIARMKGHKVKF